MTAGSMPQSLAEAPLVCLTTTDAEPDLRIRKQIREMKKCELRRNSVIICGLPNSDVNITSTVFKEISNYLINKQVYK